jgi:hypothetical protein
MKPLFTDKRSIGNALSQNNGGGKVGETVIASPTIRNITGHNLALGAFPELPQSSR